MCDVWCPICDIWCGCTLCDVLCVLHDVWRMMSLCDMQIMMSDAYFWYGMHDIRCMIYDVWRVAYGRMVCDVWCVMHDVVSHGCAMHVVCYMIFDVWCEYIMCYVWWILVHIKSTFFIRHDVIQKALESYIIMCRICYIVSSSTIHHTSYT